ncbi:hypothetical protein ACFLQ8_03660, partial [Candidatus Auribacterota bacterium]
MMYDLSLLSPGKKDRRVYGTQRVIEELDSRQDMSAPDIWRAKEIAWRVLSYLTAIGRDTEPDEFRIIQESRYERKAAELDEEKIVRRLESVPYRTMHGIQERRLFKEMLIRSPLGLEGVFASSSEGDLINQREDSIVQVSAVTARGARDIQEDVYVNTEIDAGTGARENGRLMIVADGHNGSGAAEIVRKNAVKLFKKYLSAGRDEKNNVETALAMTVNTLVELARDETSGTTLSIVYIPDDENRAYAAVLGDSPVIIRDEKGIIKESPTHNVRLNPEAVDEAEDKGAQFDGRYINLHDKKTGEKIGGIEMSRCLGNVELDPILGREPDIYSVPLGTDSVVVVGSDGLLCTDYPTTDDDIDKIVKLGGTGAGARAVVRDALLWDRSSDNTTAVVWAWPEVPSREAVNAALFNKFDLMRYKLLGTDGDKDKAAAELINEVLPKIVALKNTPLKKDAIDFLKGILSTTDYRIGLRMAVAKALLEIAGPGTYGIINPFFVRDLIKYSRGERKKIVSAVPGEEDLNRWTLMIELLGNSRSEDSDLYLDVRGEIAAWYMFALGSMRSMFEQKGDGALTDPVFVRSKELLQWVQSMMSVSREYFRKSLHDTPMEADEWTTRVNMERSNLGSMTDIEGMNIPFIEEILLDPEVVQESVLLLYGKRLKRGDIHEVTFRHAGVGASKTVYIVRIEDKGGDVYTVVRNIVIKPQNKVLREGGMVTSVDEEMQRLMFRQPRNFELMGGAGTHENAPGEYVVYWDEQYIPGKTFYFEEYDEEDVTKVKYLDQTYQEMLEGDRSPGFVKRARRGIRKYVKVCFQLWDAENRRRTDYDVNVWNFIMGEDEEPVMIDAGPHREGAAGIANYWAMIRRNIGMIMDGLQLWGDITNEDIHAGVLDALGEREGLAVLEEISEVIGSPDFDFGEETEKMLQKIPEIEDFVMNESPGAITEYIEKDRYRYVPAKVDVPLKSSEKTYLSNMFEYFTIGLYIARELHQLKESPWLWAHINRRYLSRRPGALPASQDQNLNIALGELISRIRSEPDLLMKDKNELDAWIESKIDNYKLNEEQAYFLRRSVSYEDGLRMLLEKEFSEKLRSLNIDPEARATEIGEVIDMVIALNNEPEEAAKEVKDMFREKTADDDPRVVLLRDMGYPIGSEGYVLAEEAFQDFLRHQLERDLVEKGSFVSFLKQLELNELLPHVKYDYDHDYYNDLMRDFLLEDYKDFAESYKQWIIIDPDRAA